MEYSKVTYEEVQKFEEVKGYEGRIYYNDGKYYFTKDEGTVFGYMVVYDLPKELYDLLVSGEKTFLDISRYLSEGEWPPTEEEIRAHRREFIFEHPTSLILSPPTQDFFSYEELEKLIPIGEKKCLELNGKLPDYYVSPLKKKEKDL